jgi:hypothetical protein
MDAEETRIQERIDLLIEQVSQQDLVPITDPFLEEAVRISLRGGLKVEITGFDPNNSKIRQFKGSDTSDKMTIILTDPVDIWKKLNDIRSYKSKQYFVEHSEAVSPGGKRVITLMHSYGEKGSIFVKAYAKALFELIDMEPKLSSTENSVTIEV